MTENLNCFPRDLFILNICLACVDGILACIAFTQLIRIHMRNQQIGWTRQKVLHLMVGSSNFGYLVYFISTLVATCKGWLCWSHACGFILMASPRILFLTAFLLLLSFWVDLCHQANDEEDEDESFQQALLESSKNIPGSAHVDGHWKCCSLQHVGSRQKFVIMVVVLVFFVMMSFAVVIWVGVGKNPIDPSAVARVYEQCLSVTTLILAGALGCYSLLLFSRLRKVRSEKASSEMWKVAGLAVVCVVCFPLSAVVALLTDIPLFYHWNLHIIYGVKALVYLILYYFIGSSLPSAFLLWIIRELPPSITIHRPEQSTAFTFITHGASGTHQPQCWVTATSSTNQGSRASPI
ncbi:Tobamovirus multiplication protein 1-like [Quillaja saponaria]|uniref:Tobamovirus multiplication protein 1-like n=1 Tax=Quillaja saponaria TaxID=32244 RepID=A0AAD7PMI4_QUISA|nr:Tobamovirus multiplication protein 1-like [Quillaja saponaria]